MCCCIRRQRRATNNTYKPLPQVDAESQVGEPFYYDRDAYEMNVGYPGSYIPDVVQMRSDGDENMMPPMMVYPYPGQSQAGYPPYMMPNMFYTVPYLPPVHPWQVYPADMDPSQFVPEDGKQ